MVWKLLIGTGVGGALGYAYYEFIGCPTGTCPLSSNPWIITPIGMWFGLMISMRCCGRCKTKQ
jgi:hypothetical protein